MPKEVTLQELVGSRFQYWREFSPGGVSQNDIARAARSFGLNWTPTTVSELESGGKHLSAADLMLLPAILARAVEVQSGGNATAHLSISDLIGDTRRVRLTDAGAWATGTELAAMLVADAAPPIRRPRTSARPVIGEAEVKAARRLGVTVSDIDRASQSLWHKSLTEHRDAIVEQRLPSPTDRKMPKEEARTRQAVRGRVTRELLNELEQAIEGVSNGER